MTFSRELKLAVDQVQSDVDEVFAEAVARTFNRVVLITPVDTGQAQASWLVGATNDGRTGNEVLNVTPADIKPFEGNVLLYANLPYIERLEDGYSDQAPSGMVKIAVGEWAKTVRQVDERNKR